MQRGDNSEEEGEENVRYGVFFADVGNNMYNESGWYAEKN